MSETRKLLKIKSYAKINSKMFKFHVSRTKEYYVVKILRVECDFENLIS